MKIEDSNRNQNQPDWEKRLPGEQWIVMDSVAAAEAYLTIYTSQEVKVIRVGYPNNEGLYARIQFPDRITENRIFIPN